MDCVHRRGSRALWELFTAFMTLLIEFLPLECDSLYNPLNLTDLHSLNPDFFLLPVQIRLNAIVGVEHGGYISLKVIVSVDLILIILVR